MAEMLPPMQPTPRRPAIVVRAAQQPTLTPIAGGWIADTGRAGPARQMLLMAADALRSCADQAIVWVIQAEALTHELANPGLLCAWLHHFEQVRRAGAAAHPRGVAVIPQTGPQARALAHLIKSLGLCVYDSAPDGTVYAEAAPCGRSMPGVAGPVIDGEAALTLRRIAEQRADPATGSAERQDLTLIEILFVQTVLQMCCPPGWADSDTAHAHPAPPLLARAVGAPPSERAVGEARYRSVA